MKVYKAIQTVSAAMSAAGIGKGRKNLQQGYAFRGIDDVLNSLSSALVEAGLCILPRVVSREVVERQTQKGGALFYVCVQVDFDLVSTEDGSKHTVTTFGEAMDSADKATNKAMSAAYKYLALLTFCIPTEGLPDSDADFTTHDVKPAQTKAAPLDPIRTIVQRVEAGRAPAAADQLANLPDDQLQAIWAKLPTKIRVALQAAWPKQEQQEQSA
jgi:hypothetical protein